MSGRGVGAGSGRSGKSFEQLEREVQELRRLVKELTQPKSKARVVNTTIVGTGLAQTGELGISGRAGAGTELSPWVFGSGTALRIDVATGVLTDEEITLRNSVSTPIAADRVVQYKRIGSFYFIDVDDCPG